MRSLVAGIQSTMQQVGRLAASFQHSKPCPLGTATLRRTQSSLARVLESKEWTMEDWESIEDAAIHWMQELQSTVSACAEAAEASQTQHQRLQAQISTLFCRVQLAEEKAASADEAEMAARTREARAKEEASASASALRSMRAAMDAAQAAHQSQIAVSKLVGRNPAAELIAQTEERAMLAEASSAHANSEVALMRDEIDRLRKLLREEGVAAGKLDTQSSARP